MNVERKSHAEASRFIKNIGACFGGVGVVVSN